MKFRLDNEDYELASVDEMTMGDQRDFEKIAEAPVTVLADLSERWSAASMVAWMAVSIRKQKPEQPLSDVVARLDQLKPADLEMAWTEAERQSPPSTSNGNGAAAETSNAGSPTGSAPAPDSSSPTGTGSRGSVTTSISDRKTSNV